MGRCDESTAQTVLLSGQWSDRWSRRKCHRQAGGRAELLLPAAAAGRWSAVGGLLS